MNARKETIADIVAGMRKRADEIRHDLSTVPIRRDDQLAEIMMLEDEANRIEAAAARESEDVQRKAFQDGASCAADTVKRCDMIPSEDAVGNAAAMREALANMAEYARSVRCHTEDAYVIWFLEQIEAFAKYALSAPPRNCDKIRDWREAVKIVLELKLGNGYELLEYLFAPADEGGAE